MPTLTMSPTLGGLLKYELNGSYCRETVTLKRFFGGADAFMVNVVIRFEGIQDLSAEVLAEKGYSGMSVVPKGVAVDVDFLILYELNAAGKIQYIKGAVHVSAPR